MGLLSSLISLFSCNGQTNKNQPTFDETFEIFQTLDYRLNHGVEKSDVSYSYAELSEFGLPPLSMTYQILGLTIEREPWTPITNKCWTFDLEAIEDHGAYIDIMENISRITNGDLIFKDLKDYVDIEAGKAWVSFTCNRDTYKWDLKVDNDWADGDLFDRVQDLAKKYNTQRKFTYFNTGGQDFVLGYSTPDELDKIRKATGLNIVILKAKGQIY